jgi:hypothetical protein
MAAHDIVPLVLLISCDDNDPSSVLINLLWTFVLVFHEVFFIIRKVMLNSYAL